MSSRLADTRCSQVDEEDVPLIAAVTTLAEKTVEKRVNDWHGNTLVSRVFEDYWPTDAESLGELTVALAQRAELEVELAAVTGLGPRAVRNRLDKVHGKTLVKNAFPELHHDDEEADEGDGEDDEGEEEEEDEQEDEEEDPTWKRYGSADDVFDPVELLGAIRITTIRLAAPLVEWIASVAKLTPRGLMRKLSEAHGSSLLRTVLADRWPVESSGQPREILGGLGAGLVRRSPPLVRWIADVAGLDPQDARDRLVGAHWKSHVTKTIPEVLDRREGTRAGKLTSKPRRTDSSPPASTQAGARLVDNRYLLGRHLAKGGFCTVYEATHVDTPEQRVVIKLEIPGSPASLRNEMGNAYGLTHQNICSYKYCGRDAVLGTYLVLQYWGSSLEQVIQQRGVIAVSTAIDVVGQAAAGLDYAHKKGVIHHDVKPGNILVEQGDGEWEVRVTDFGISLKGTAGKNTAGKHTVFATHPVGYTRAYAAPEQLEAAKGRKASDQYSLALVFCSMLEGRVFNKRYDRRPFGRLSARQNDAVRQALAKEPDERFDSCTEFWAALRRK